MGVTATPTALDTLARLRAAHGPLVLFQSGGCCDGSSPMCFQEGQLPPSPNDLLLGAVDDTPFYVDAEQYRRWHSPDILLDAAPGPADSFSLEALEGMHFVARTHACPPREGSSGVT